MTAYWCKVTGGGSDVKLFVQEFHLHETDYNSLLCHAILYNALLILYYTVLCCPTLPSPVLRRAAPHSPAPRVHCYSTNLYYSTDPYCMYVYYMLLKDPLRYALFLGCGIDVECFSVRYNGRHARRQSNMMLF